MMLIMTNCCDCCDIDIDKVSSSVIGMVIADKTVTQTHRHRQIL